MLAIKCRHHCVFQTLEFLANSAHLEKILSLFYKIIIIYFFKYMFE